jgi:hypothetical protein
VTAWKHPTVARVGFELSTTPLRRHLLLSISVVTISAQCCSPVAEAAEEFGPAVVRKHWSTDALRRSLFDSSVVFDVELACGAGAAITDALADDELPIAVSFATPTCPRRGRRVPLPLHATATHARKHAAGVQLRIAAAQCAAAAVLESHQVSIHFRQSSHSYEQSSTCRV